jgi:hypothetical protein
MPIDMFDMFLCASMQRLIALADAQGADGDHGGYVRGQAGYQSKVSLV